MSAERFDVVVVGAGFTGLSAALALKEQGLSVLVLEARDRVGGRTETRINGLGEPVDTGGQFFCEDMPAMMALAERYGLVAIECAVEGDVAQRPPTDPGEPGGGSLFERSSALRERMNAADLDGPEGALTVADWIDRQDDQPQVVRKALRSTVEGLWCLPADGMPLWSLVEQDRRITNETWELQYALDIGMQGLAERLAVELGDGIRLTAPVTGIEHDAAGVRIHAGDIFVAARVLVAVPPVAAARIAFDPPLPDRLAKALAAWESGAVIKILLRYSEPFWRARGLSGMVAWRDPAGIFACEAPLKTGRPALVAFVGGPIATHWNTLGLDALKRWLLGELAAALGPQAAEPLDVHMRDWTDDRWSAGGYGDMVMRMDARDAEDVIRAGVGPIRFASSELSPSFPGYVEGAIVAGRAAATDSWR